MKRPTKRPTTKLVESCTVCPFAEDGERVGDDQWSCHANYDEHGWPRRLDRTGSMKAPTWCPLRSRPILVKLRRGA